MKKDTLFLELEVSETEIKFPDSISDELIDSTKELELIESRLNETIESIEKVKPNCDKTDYILSVCSGFLCGIIDVFLVGDPKNSPINKMTDKWYANRIIDFSKMCGYKGDKDSLSKAIKYLEDKFKIPYDQSVGGDIFKELTNITPSNHHFKSLGHNPTILGLFFSILNQFGPNPFEKTFSFVSNGQLITLKNSDSSFELQGNTIISKIYCGFINWIGHLLSDVSGSSSSKGRGMGIPSPFMTWTNDIIVLKNKFNIPVSNFDKSINELAMKIFEEGYDLRFQTTQIIPVLINELIVRFIYSIRRLMKYYSKTKKDNINISSIWKECNPFSSPDVKRMLTVAHGTFCIIDLSDAFISGCIYGTGSFNIEKFIIRVNIIGIGRFAISVLGELNNNNKINKLESNKNILLKNKSICNYYIEGLKELSQIYDDKDLLTFINELKNSKMYKEAFDKSVVLARKRNVPEKNILKNKEEIDLYFKGENINGKKQI